MLNQIKHFTQYYFLQRINAIINLGIGSPLFNDNSPSKLDCPFITEKIFTKLYKIKKP